VHEVSEHAHHREEQQDLQKPAEREDYARDHFGGLVLPW
jgi:hypothetical protein